MLWAWHATGTHFFVSINMVMEELIEVGTLFQRVEQIKKGCTCYLRMGHKVR